MNPAAVEMAKKQRDISVAEFFEKNRHLLGFDNKRKALLTAVKEAVDNSVEYHEPVLVRDNGVIRLVKIGEYIDSMLRRAEVTKSKDVESAGVRDVEVLVYDDMSFKYGFKPASSVHRHVLHDKLYEITLTGNRTVRVTGSHSIFVLKRGRVLPFKVSELQEGDYVIVPRKPISQAGSVDVIDLRLWIKNLPRKVRSRLVIKGVSHMFSGIPTDWKRFNYIPVDHFIANGIEIPKSGQLGVKQGRSTIPVQIEVTHELMRLLGYYAAEGTCYEQWVTYSFGVHEQELIQDAENCLKQTFPNMKIGRVMAHKTAITLKLYSEILAYFFKKFLNAGGKANAKKVPAIVFNAGGELQQSFLGAYIAGDGHRGEKITIATVSEQLATGIKYLFAFQGIPFSEYVREERLREFSKKYISKCRRVYYLYIYPSQRRLNSPLSWVPVEESGFRSIISMLNPKIGSFNPHYRMIGRDAFTYESTGADLKLALVNRRAELTGAAQKQISFIESLLSGDIGFLKVKKIEETISDHQYVYDFSVPGYEKFLGGRGAIFLHNSLDACEDARILPEVVVEMTDMGNDRFKVVVEDNGPGIVEEQIPKIFARLLYGSKFHKLSQSRGQQGIGISAAVLYAQLTTGKPAKITSRISPAHIAHYYELHINTSNNKPEIVKKDTVDWKKEHGTRIEIELEATYIKGMQSVDEYLKQTAIINPHATFIYTNPKAEQVVFARASEQLPRAVKDIKPHPYGVELGRLSKMLKDTDSRTLQAFLISEFSRVGPGTAKEICENAALLPSAKPSEMSMHDAEQLAEGIKKTKIIAPPTDCLSPITEELVEQGLRKEINAEFYCATTRPAGVYRGNPFQIEAGIAYGGDISADAPVMMLRFANRVPLLYQQGACAIAEAICKMNWKAYGMQQSHFSVPVGPAVVLVHMSSVWVPFTSEAKEALAHYPEIMREIKLALQECGRKLSIYVNKKLRVKDELNKRGYIETYIPYISEALKELLGNKEFDEAKVNGLLKVILERTRGQVEKVGFNPDKNEDFDEKLALKRNAGNGEENEDSE